MPSVKRYLFPWKKKSPHHNQGAKFHEFHGYDNLRQSAFHQSMSPVGAVHQPPPPPHAFSQQRPQQLYHPQLQHQQPNHNLQHQQQQQQQQHHHHLNNLQHHHFHQQQLIQTQVIGSPQPLANQCQCQQCSLKHVQQTTVAQQLPSAQLIATSPHLQLQAPIGQPTLQVHQQQHCQQQQSQPLLYPASPQHYVSQTTQLPAVTQCVCHCPYQHQQQQQQQHQHQNQPQHQNQAQLQQQQHQHQQHQHQQPLQFNSLVHTNGGCQQQINQISSIPQQPPVHDHHHHHDQHHNQQQIQLQHHQQQQQQSQYSNGHMIQQTQVSPGLAPIVAAQSTTLPAALQHQQRPQQQQFQTVQQQTFQYHTIQTQQYQQHQSQQHTHNRVQSLHQQPIHQTTLQSRAQTQQMMVQTQQVHQQRVESQSEFHDFSRYANMQSLLDGSLRTQTPILASKYQEHVYCNQKVPVSELPPYDSPPNYATFMEKKKISSPEVNGDHMTHHSESLQRTKDSSYENLRARFSHYGNLGIGRQEPGYTS